MIDSHRHRQKVIRKFSHCHNFLSALLHVNHFVAFEQDFRFAEAITNAEFVEGSSWFEVDSGSQESFQTVKTAKLLKCQSGFRVIPKFGESIVA